MHQLTALGLTLAIELPVLALLARALPPARVWVVAAGASLLTHPMAWHIASVLPAEQYRVGLWLIEIGVTITEGLWYQFWLRPGIGRALWWSLLANVASFGFGWVLLSVWRP